VSNPTIRATRAGQECPGHCRRRPETFPEWRRPEICCFSTCRRTGPARGKKTMSANRSRRATEKKTTHFVQLLHQHFTILLFTLQRLQLRPQYLHHIAGLQRVVLLHVQPLGARYHGVRHRVLVGHHILAHQFLLHRCGRSMVAALSVLAAITLREIRKMSVNEWRFQSFLKISAEAQ
jgi:hypothetical protein